MKAPLSDRQIKAVAAAVYELGAVGGRPTRIFLQADSGHSFRIHCKACGAVVVRQVDAESHTVSLRTYATLEKFIRYSGRAA